MSDEDYRDWARNEIGQLHAEIDYNHEIVDQKDGQIEELQGVVGEFMEWIRPRRKKLHPLDTMHETLERAEAMLPK